MAHTFLNVSFEKVAGSTTTIISGATEPFALSDGQALSVELQDGMEMWVFEEGSQSTVLSVDGPFPLADGQTLDVSIDGAASVTATFLLADFEDIGAASPSEVVAVLLLAIPGLLAFIEGDAVRVGSLTKGATSLVTITGGTAAGAFGFPAGAPGVDYFANIASATAVEVVARIAAQTAGVTPTAPGGAVQLTAIDEGNDACIKVLSSGANTVFLFPTAEVCGVSNPGFARAWLLATVCARWEFADFSALLLWPSAAESFSLGWSGNEGDLQTIDLDALTTAMFDVVEFWESFSGWWAYQDELPALAAAVFDAALVPSVYEDFLGGWPSIPGNEDDVVVLPVVSDAPLNFGLDLEAFSLGWPSLPGNELDSTVLGPLTTAVFATVDDFESFDSTTTVALQYQVTTPAVAAGDRFDIVIDGSSHPEIALVATTDVATAANLASTISTGPTSVSAVGSGNSVLITQTVPGEAITYSAYSVPAGGLFLVLGDVVDPETDWPGLYYNPAL